MGRMDYTAKEVAKYREQVVKYIVPVCTELRKRQAKRLGILRRSRALLRVAAAAGHTHEAGGVDHR